jgi:hypothetical protein
MAKIIFRKDASQTKALVKAARVSAKRAYSGSRALGLTVSYIKDGIVFKEDADGNAVAVKQIEQINVTPFELKKGLVLHVK